ncbi:MAG: protein-L-isoaspartate O-methyltransferase [archaeon]
MRKFEVIFDEEDVAYYAFRDSPAREGVAERLAEAYERAEEKNKGVEPNLGHELPLIGNSSINSYLSELQSSEPNLFKSPSPYYSMNKPQLLASLKSHGFSKPILEAFSKVKRENFIDSRIKHMAYEDRALPLGKGQTISQPYTIAMMLDLLDLKKGQKVLEIGSGCGYVLALISTITKTKVYGIEIVESLYKKSKSNLKDYNVEIYNMSGANGLKEHSPYDRIIISAALDKIPKPILNQLKLGGICIAPEGPRGNQALVAVQRIKNKFIVKKKIQGFSFVPFVGG